MNNPSDKYVVDTNVPVVANLATSHDKNDNIPLDCINACVEAIEHIVKKGGLVIDNKYEIYGEYRNYLALRGEPGVGDGFMKWVHDNQCQPEKVEQISITKSDNSYKEFPEHDGLSDFDKDDQKFVAVANAHSVTDKPHIMQAVDSKWWGWKDALNQVGINVRFLCPDYVKEKYKNKMNR